MATNPMQRKARNSFLLGLVVMLIIALIIGFIFYLIYGKDLLNKNSEKGEQVKAYVLNTDIKSGQIVLPSMLSEITIYSGMIPNNYIDSTKMLQLEIQDIDGNILQTTKVDEKEVMYLKIKDITGYKLISKKNEDKEKIEILKDSSGYYRTKDNGDKEYIELVSTPCVAKINMNKNTVLTLDSITKSDEVTTNDLRLTEYNMISLPTTLTIGDRIDIRISLGNGQDFIVISKKEVKSILGNTIGLNLSEGEILMMNSAIVESYVIKTANIYAIQYIDPGMQKEAIKTYVPTNEVKALMESDANIVTTAKQDLLDKIERMSQTRNQINNERMNYAGSETENLESGITKQIENAKKAREAYLSGLTTY